MSGMLWYMAVVLLMQGLVGTVFLRSAIYFFNSICVGTVEGPVLSNGRKARYEGRGSLDQLSSLAACIFIMGTALLSALSTFGVMFLFRERVAAMNAANQQGWLLLAAIGWEMLVMSIAFRLFMPTTLVRAFVVIFFYKLLIWMVYGTVLALFVYAGGHIQF